MIYPAQSFLSPSQQNIQKPGLSAGWIRVFNSFPTPLLPGCFEISNSMVSTPLSHPLTPPLWCYAGSESSNPGAGPKSLPASASVSDKTWKFDRIVPERPSIQHSRPWCFCSLAAFNPRRKTCLPGNAGELTTRRHKHVITSFRACCICSLRSGSCDSKCAFCLGPRSCSCQSCFMWMWLATRGCPKHRIVWRSRRRHRGGWSL